MTVTTLAGPSKTYLFRGRGRRGGEGWWRCGGEGVLPVLQCLGNNAGWGLRAIKCRIIIPPSLADSHPLARSLFPHEHYIKHLIIHR